MIDALSNNSSESINSTEANFNTSVSLNSTEPNFEVAAPPAWTVVLFILFMVVIMVLAVLGNGVILIVEQFNKQKTSTDWLVTFMSVNDLVLSCNVPIYILFYAGDWEHVGSDALCGFMAFIQETCSYASTLLLTVTSLDRYVKTCHPHTKGITPRRSMYICIGVTLFTLPITSSLPFYSVMDANVKCFYKIPPEPRAILRGLMFFVQATYMLSFIAVIMSYCKIAHTIRTRIKARRRNDHRSGLARDPVLQQASQVEHSFSQTIVTRLTTGRDNKVSPLFAEPSALSALDSDTPHVNGDITTAAHVKNSDNTPVFAISENQHNGTSLNGLPQSSHTVQKDNDGPSQNQAQKRRAAKDQRDSKEAQMNKTTAIMFAVTIVFILSWIPPWLLPNLFKHPVVELLCRRTFMVNTCTNPLFYITMSSAFRNLTKQTLKKVLYRLQMALGIVRDV